MAFITDAELLRAVADRLKATSANELPAFWANTIVPRANEAAYQDILGALMSRGFTKAQVDSWDRGAEFNLAIGTYWALVNGGVVGTFDPETLRALDRRKELATTLVFAGGVWLKPTGDQPGLVTTAGPSAAGGMFNWPDPDDPALGGYLGTV